MSETMRQVGTDWAGHPIVACPCGAEMPVALTPPSGTPVAVEREPDAVVQLDREHRDFGVLFFPGSGGYAQWQSNSVPGWTPVYFGAPLSPDSERVDWWEAQRVRTLVPVMESEGWRLCEYSADGLVPVGPFRTTLREAIDATRAADLPEGFSRIPPEAKTELRDYAEWLRLPKPRQEFHAWRRGRNAEPERPYHPDDFFRETVERADAAGHYSRLWTAHSEGRCNLDSCPYDHAAPAPVSADSEREPEFCAVCGYKSCETAGGSEPCVGYNPNQESPARHDPARWTRSRPWTNCEALAASTRATVAALTTPAGTQPGDVHAGCRERAEHDAARIRELVAMRENDPWLWEEDGDNDLASLSSECPILIMPRTLERLLAAGTQGTGEARGGEALDAVARERDYLATKVEDFEAEQSRFSRGLRAAYAAGLERGRNPDSREALDGEAFRQWLRVTPSPSEPEHPFPGGPLSDGVNSLFPEPPTREGER